MDGSSVARPRNVVGTVGFLLVTVGLLGTVAASLVLFSFLLKLQDPVDPTATAPMEVDDDWWPSIVAMRCGFAVIVVGTVASLFGLRRKPQKLARWGAVVGLIVVAMVSAMSIWAWWSSTD